MLVAEVVQEVEPLRLLLWAEQPVEVAAELAATEGLQKMFLA